MVHKGLLCETLNFVILHTIYSWIVSNEQSKKCRRCIYTTASSYFRCCCYCLIETFHVTQNHFRDMKYCFQAMLGWCVPGKSCTKGTSKATPYKLILFSQVNLTLRNLTSKFSLPKIFQGNVICWYDCSYISKC